MKKNYILGAFAVASLAFTACSSDDLSEELGQETVKPEVPEAQVSNGFKELGTFSLTSTLGNAVAGSAVSRTPGDIDELGRPSGEYPLSTLGTMTMYPSIQPTEECLGKVYNAGFTFEQSQIQFQSATKSHYKLYYKTVNTVKHLDQNASESGQLYLSKYPDGHDPLIYDLSVFDLDLLRDTLNNIPLNKFAYSVAEQLDDAGERYKVRGSSMRHVSYNPSEIPNIAKSKDPVPSDLKGRYLALPVIESNTEGTPDLEFLKDPTYEISRELVTEIPDQYFVGPECLFAADGEDIYILSTVMKSNPRGGYYYVAKYPYPKGIAEPARVEMSRLTTVVNTSFMLVDQKEWSESSYFVPGNKAQTLANYKSRYNVDLSTLECPYATFDGFNSMFFVNDEEHDKKTFEPRRMVMWAKGLKTIAANGREYEKSGKPSMDINFSFKDSKQLGYGIKGDSYVVAFPGADTDTNGQLIQFYVTVDGVNILIQAGVPDSQGIAFTKNTAHHVNVYVNAKDFAAKVAELKRTPSRSNGNNYSVLKVSSDNVVVSDQPNF